MRLSGPCILLLACALAACGGEAKETSRSGPDEAAKPLRYGPGEMDHGRLRPVKVSGRVLASGDYLGRPSRIVSMGETLLVLDNTGDSVLHVISARDGRRVRSQGRRGAGPGEYQAAWSLAPDPRDAGSAWVFDMGLSRLTRVSPGDPAGPKKNPEILTLRADLMPVQPLWLGDSVLVSPNFSPRGRLTFFNRAGTLLRAAGGVPNDTRGTPPGVLQQAWVGKLALRPAGDRMVIATQYADQIELYGTDGTLLKKVRGPFQFDPRFTVAIAGDMQTMSSDESMRMGYADVTATNESIYALFSGRTREGFGQDAPFGRFVHVYDWEGKLLRVLELDAAIISLALSPDGRRMYGAAHDPEPVIMVFDLKS
jgi:hypothetical protein